MKNLLILITSFTVLSAGFINPDTGWEYQQSTLQAFYMLESTQIDGIEVEGWELLDDDEILSSGDVIGAFHNGVCVGWVHADPNGFTTVPLMGNDGSVGSEGYLSDGDVADLFIYDATHGEILPLDISATSVDFYVDNLGAIDLDGFACDIDEEGYACAVDGDGNICALNSRLVRKRNQINDGCWPPDATNAIDPARYGAGDTTRD